MKKILLGLMLLTSLPSFEN